MLTSPKVVLVVLTAMFSAAPQMVHAGVWTSANSPPSSALTADGIELAAAKRKYRVKPGCRATFCKPGYNRPAYKKWQRKKQARRIIAGVTLGAIIATTVNAVPRRPSPDLCWHWANPSRTRGYWDYCY